MRRSFLQLGLAFSILIMLSILAIQARGNGYYSHCADISGNGPGGCSIGTSVGGGGTCAELSPGDCLSNTNGCDSSSDSLSTVCLTYWTYLVSSCTQSGEAEECGVQALYKCDWDYGAGHCSTVAIQDGTDPCFVQPCENS